MKSLIVFYSQSGNTRFAAQQIAAQTGADVLEIAPREAYPDKGFQKYFWGGKSAVMGDTPELLPYDVNLDDYDMVILGTPVWASNITPPLRTFVCNHRDVLAAKKLALFVCFSGGGADKAVAKFKTLMNMDSLQTTLVLVDPKDRSKPQHQAQILQFGEELKSV